MIELCFVKCSDDSCADNSRQPVLFWKEAAAVKLALISLTGVRLWKKAVVDVFDWTAAACCCGYLLLLRLVVVLRLRVVVRNINRAKLRVR